MIKNILVIRNDRFGEFLLNIPAMRALKETYPDAKLTLAVEASVQELARCIECVDSVEVWNEAFKKNLKQRRFDLCVILNPAKEAHWASFFSGIPTRVGYNRKWGILLTHKMPDKKNLGLKHEVEYNLDLVGLIGARTRDKTISLTGLPAVAIHEYRGAIAIHPFTSDPRKQWPRERFRELARRITQELKAKVVLVGRTENWGQSPATEGSPVGTGTVPNLLDLVNQTSLVGLAQILKQCKLLISGDSGPMHLGAAVGTPVIALFRNDLAGKTPKRWGPWGSRHTVIEKDNLLNITVDEVFQQVKQGLLCPA